MKRIGFIIAVAAILLILVTILGMVVVFQQPAGTEMISQEEFLERIEGQRIGINCYGNYWQPEEKNDWRKSGNDILDYYWEKYLGEEREQIKIYLYLNETNYKAEEVIFVIWDIKCHDYKYPNKIPRSIGEDAIRKLPIGKSIPVVNHSDKLITIEEFWSTIKDEQIDSSNYPKYIKCGGYHPVPNKWSKWSRVGKEIAYRSKDLKYAIRIHLDDSNYPYLCFFFPEETTEIPEDVVYDALLKLQVKQN